MRLIGLAVVLTLCLVLGPLVGKAQQPRKVYRVGILSPGFEQPSALRYYGPFRQSLADSGYVEGMNVSFSYRWGEDDFSRLPALASELVRVGVDVLFSVSTPAIRALPEATTRIPIVVVAVLDPIDAGLVASLARPGGNITGVSGRVMELHEKLLELLKESKPSTARVAIFGHPTTIERDHHRMEAAARSLGVRLQFLGVTSLKELEEAFETAAKARAEGLVLLPTVLFARNESRIAVLARVHRLSTIFWRSPQFAEAGGLMAYGPDDVHALQRAGALVAKILKGARPSDLPVEQADRFRLAINLKTAKVLGLTIPQSLLLRADQVIE
jgi:putative tryptophan/tyrosine transport system substrate-binding protein